jgi:hypothetical protein
MRLPERCPVELVEEARAVNARITFSFIRTVSHMAAPRAVADLFLNLLPVRQREFHVSREFWDLRKGLKYKVLP